MAKKFSKRNIRKITRSGNSLSVSLPVEFLAKLGCPPASPERA